MRRDFFEIVERARQLLFNVKVKTNGEKEAARLRQLGVEQIQIRGYSHRPQVHDAITKLPGSLQRTIRAIRLLKSQGLKVRIANVLMVGNFSDQQGVVELARELGVVYTLDPTITPRVDGDRSTLALRIPGSDLKQVFHNQELVGDVEEFCAPPPAPGEDIMEGYPCSAGHSACYISPYGDVFPCAQFPLPSSNLRRQKFLDIWRHSPLLNEVRSIRARDLQTCSAYTEGNMRGPSTADCEKSFQRTGIPSANMIRRTGAAYPGPPIQIQALANSSPIALFQGEDGVLPDISEGGLGVYAAVSKIKAHTSTLGFPFTWIPGQGGNERTDREGE
jgi:MoaA/NifB/PqqE/SkfB family radical SAM enzyme